VFANSVIFADRGNVPDFATHVAGLVFSSKEPKIKVTIETDRSFVTIFKEDKGDGKEPILSYIRVLTEVWTCLSGTRIPSISVDPSQGSPQVDPARAIELPDDCISHAPTKLGQELGLPIDLQI
jgi:hypothetical protein